MIREATPADFETLRTIERTVGEMFRRIGMDEIADDQPATDAELLPFVESGMAWVETDRDDRPIAYLLLEQIDGRAHIEQVTVHPAHARRGIGAALIDTAGLWAHRQHLGGLTLTTFAEVPWNAPYYARLGFAVLPEELWTAGLRQRFVREAARGLHAWPRVIMLRGLDDTQARVATDNA